jgi:hypothetical protein
MQCGKVASTAAMGPNPPTSICRSLQPPRARTLIVHYSKALPRLENLTSCTPTNIARQSSTHFGYTLTHANSPSPLFLDTQTQYSPSGEVNQLYNHPTQCSTATQHTLRVYTHPRRRQPLLLDSPHSPDTRYAVPLRGDVATVLHGTSGVMLTSGTNTLTQCGGKCFFFARWSPSLCQGCISDPGADSITPAVATWSR